MIHTETVKSVKGTNVTTEEGSSLQSIGHDPRLKAGEIVYTDGTVAYGNQRRLEVPQIIDDSEKIVPLYASSCGYVKLNGNYVAKDFAAKKDGKTVYRTRKQCSSEFFHHILLKTIFLNDQCIF